MAELAERVRALGAQIQAGADADHALAGLHAKLRRRRTRRLALAATAGSLCLCAGALVAVRAWHATGLSRTATRPAAPFTLGDGSVVTPADPSSRLWAKTVSPRLIELELLAGSARFEVAPNREREFRVSTGRVAVTVVGTRFTVARQGERTAVTVESGRVRVEWERGQQVLEPGERGVFPPFEPAAPAATEPPARAPEAPAGEPRATPPRAASDWRALANRGDFPAAYRGLRDRARAANPTTTDDLLLAADVARRTGHAAESVPYLERALASHPDESRAAVVAFTLGRVRLADLDDPEGAAAAFARARAAAPRGPLAEDALAREVEARARSGDPSRARALAEEYLATWPAGAHAVAVRHFGGLP
jgi:transmembrane sensor